MNHLSRVARRFAPLRHASRLAGLAVISGLPALPPRAAAQINVPLQLVNLGSSIAPEYKLGIYVGLGGGNPKLYEFDTGAAGFFPAYSPTYTPWWNSFTPTSDNLVMSYASGIQYNTTIVTTSVSLYGSDAPGSPALASVTTNVGQIEQATGSKVANWNQDLIDGTPPLYGAFYGDFGMALYRNAGNTPVPPSNPANPSIYAILPQLGANTSALGNGFILHMGDYNNPTPTLQIGLTPADRARFSNTVAMNAPVSPTQTGTFPFGGGPSYSQQLISGNLILNVGQGNETNNQNIGTVMDTGAPSTEIHLYNGTVLVPDPIDNVQFSGLDTLSGNQDLLMAFNTGNLMGFNDVSTTSGINPLSPTTGYVNTGLNLFFQNDVMFDMENGVVGFAAPVPEPAIFAALFGAIALGIVIRRRKR